MTRRVAITVLAGAAVARPRNPLIDPRPWDVVEKNGIQVHVHSTVQDAKHHVIYAGKFRSTGEAMDMIQCSLRTWREQCVGAVVVQRAEDVLDA